MHDEEYCETLLHSNENGVKVSGQSEKKVSAEKVPCTSIAVVHPWVIASGGLLMSFTVAKSSSAEEPYRSTLIVEVIVTHYWCMVLLYPTLAGNIRSVQTSICIPSGFYIYVQIGDMYNMYVKSGGSAGVFRCQASGLAILVAAAAAPGRMNEKQNCARQTLTKKPRRTWDKPHKKK